MPDVQNKKPTKVALLGGDLRQLAAKEALENLGYSVALYGFDTYGCHPSLSLEEALDGHALIGLMHSAVSLGESDRLFLVVGNGADGHRVLQVAHYR